jgi:hypothetical protein
MLSLSLPLLRLGPRVAPPLPSSPPRVGHEILGAGGKLKVKALNIIIEMIINIFA